MNRGFAFYFKNAMKSSASTIWKNKGFIWVLAFFLSELVGRVTIIFSAIFDLADIRQAKTADENRKADFPNALKVATKRKPLRTMILSIISEAFIFLGGVLIIAIITCVLWLIGCGVNSLIHGPQLVVWAFCAPGALLLAVYALIMILIFSPTPYIIETNPDLGVYETVKICFETMKDKGKTTVFFNFFIPTLIECLIVGFCAGVAWFIFAFSPVIPFATVVFAVWCIISIAIILLTVPMFDLARKIAQKNLFEDIVSDPVNAGKRTYGINIKKCRGVKFSPSEIRGNLVSLFDRTETDMIPEPDSPARKKLNERAQKEQKKPAQQSQPEGGKAATVQTHDSPADAYEHTPTVHEQTAQQDSADNEEFDLDKVVTKELDLDKFIDAQVAEAQLMQAEEAKGETAGETVKEPAPEPSPEPAEEPAPEPSAEVVNEPVKNEPQPEAQPEPAEEQPSEPAAEEKPKRKRATRKKKSE